MRLITIIMKLENFSKNLCMHIAALKPEAMDIDQSIL